MERDDRYFFLGGLGAVLFYLGLMGGLSLFFKEHRRSKLFVPHKSHSVEISLMQLPQQLPEDKKLPSSQPTRSSQPKNKPTQPKPSATTSKLSAPPSATHAIASLFDGVKVAPITNRRRAARLANAPTLRYKPLSDAADKPQPKASALIKKLDPSKRSIAFGRRTGGVGEVDAYMRKLYQKLYSSWNPDALLAGTKAMVEMTIFADGHFSYRMVRPSDNPSFNRSLLEYLQQLGQRPFPPPKNHRRLVIEVEFEAKE